MKAIIMAGGSGSRLRPLTCDRPKPMVPILNKPVMQYIIELLKDYGINDIGATLYYMPDKIKDYFHDGKDHGVNISYFIEETPLGTAGSVKNAQGFLDDTFIVISGDALTNINISKAVDFHKRNQAWATLVLTRVEVPLEYGVVVTDEGCRVTRFLEKPSWGEVFSDTVNTGIYILEPKVLSFFQHGRKFDFSKDLFPMLLKQGKPIFGYIMDEYWCDIGDLAQYQQAQFDVLNGSAGIKLSFDTQKEGIFVSKGAEIHQDSKIIGPAFIGENSIIDRDVTIDSNTVVGSNVIIKPNTTIKRSIIWDNCVVGMNSELRGALLCNRVKIKDNCQVYEQAVIGDDSILNKGCIVKPMIKIWPSKNIDEGSNICTDVIWGTRYKKSLFGVKGITGEMNIEINPEFASRLGSAFGGVIQNKARIAVSTDDSDSSQMIKYSLIAGLMSTGTEVFDIGTLTVPICRYAIRFLRMDGGIHIRLKNNNIQFDFMDNKGLNISKNTEREIENLFVRGDSKKSSCEGIIGARKLQDLLTYYLNQMINSVVIRTRQDAEQITKKRICIVSDNQIVGFILNSILSELGFQVTELNKQIDYKIEENNPISLEHISQLVIDKSFDLAAILNEEGEKLILIDDRGRIIDEGIFDAFTSLVYLKANNGGKVVVPLKASKKIDGMAEKYGGRVVRSKTSVQEFMTHLYDTSTKNIEFNTDTCQYYLYFDGIAGLLKILELLHKYHIKLSELVDELPDSYMVEKSIKCPWGLKGKVMRTLIQSGEKGKMELNEGVKFNHEDGWVLVLPDTDKPVCRIFCEGYNQEIAESLTEFYIHKIEDIQNH